MSKENYASLKCKNSFAISIKFFHLSRQITATDYGDYGEAGHYGGQWSVVDGRWFVLSSLLVRLRNHNSTQGGNVDFRFSKNLYIQSLKDKYKVVLDLLVQKLLNDMT